MQLKRRRSPPPPNRRGNKGWYDDDLVRAGTFCLALLWPVILLLHRGTTSTSISPTSKMSQTIHGGKEVLSSKLAHAQTKLRTLYEAHSHDRWGYGPTNPRVAVIITGTDPDALVRSISSVFATVDRRRILCVVAVLDLPTLVTSETTTGENSTDIYTDVDRTDADQRNAIANLTERLAEIDAGETVHSHGEMGVEHTHTHTHWSLTNHTHGKRIKLIPPLSNARRGVSVSRQTARVFVEALIEQHTHHGLKREDEDVLLLLLRPDAVLAEGWIDPVTNALVLPPPLPLEGITDGDGDGDGNGRHTLPTKLSNAISLKVDYYAPGSHGMVISPPAGATLTFDATLHPKWTTDTTALLTMDGPQRSYLTAAVTGPATVLRWETWRELPSSDGMLDGYFGADLELSLNLWLCGDGIDILLDAKTVIDPVELPASESIVSDEHAARIAAAWMTDPYAEAMMKLRTDGRKEPNELTKLRELVKDARESASLPSNLRHKCHLFE
mmetsp:Transcript_6338/g.7258  ORF Transcript_6338/g.7258 Transcript_6338/m.7258 type:complete len:499 (-) Transcript_6338:500-1996(-)